MRYTIPVLILAVALQAAAEEEARTPPRPPAEEAPPAPPRIRQPKAPAPAAEEPSETAQLKKDFASAIAALRAKAKAHDAIAVEKHKFYQDFNRVRIGEAEARNAPTQADREAMDKKMAQAVTDNYKAMTELIAIGKKLAAATDLEPIKKLHTELGTELKKADTALEKNTDKGAAREIRDRIATLQGNIERLLPKAE